MDSTLMSRIEWALFAKKYPGLANDRTRAGLEPGHLAMDDERFMAYGQGNTSPS